MTYSALQMNTDVQEWMHIDWDLPVTMEDGVVLRADVFRPRGPGSYPTILSYDPYGNRAPHSTCAYRARIVATPHKETSQSTHVCLFSDGET